MGNAILYVELMCVCEGDDVYAAKCFVSFDYTHSVEILIDGYILIKV